MIDRRTTTLLCAALLTAALIVNPAAAARVRFHYVPDGNGGVQLQASPTGTPGEQPLRRGADRAYPGSPPRANYIVTVRQPYTGQDLKVPLFLPDGTPEVQHTWSRLVYNYGIYSVEIRYLADGSIDVIYDSGFLRPL
jgi:hypothetical protein